MKKITLAASIENIETVTDLVNAELEAHDCTMKAQIQIDIAIDELFGNIARYAYGDKTGEATVEVDFLGEPLAARITFIDSGVPFNPLQREDPDTTLDAKDRPIGGLGILVVKKSMDKVEYEYRDEKNMLTITKTIV